MHKILCVEDSPEIAFILQKLFKEHDVKLASSLADARRFLSQENFSLLILDIQLPDGSGLDFFAETRKQSSHSKQSVFFLTGQTDFSNKASAFELGAEDFITKPFDPQELKLRVEAKLKKIRSSTQTDDIIKFGDLTCHLNEQRLYQNGKEHPIDLTSLEFRIFRLLSQQQNRVFPRNEILERVWGDSVSVTERVVDVHISKLRKKLEPTGVKIESISGTGYRLVLRTNAPPL